MEVRFLAMNSIEEIMLPSRIMKVFMGIASIWSNLRIRGAFKKTEIRTSYNLSLSV